MRNLAIAAALAVSLAISGGALAQIVDNNIAAGMQSNILAGTPSGRSPGVGLGHVPNVVDAPTVSGRSSAISSPCGIMACDPVIVPRGHHHHMHRAR